MAQVCPCFWARCAAPGGVLECRDIVPGCLGRGPSGEKLELLRAGSAMAELASCMGLCTQSWWGRCWPRLLGLLELLKEAGGRDRDRIGSNPTVASLPLPVFNKGLGRPPMLKYMAWLQPGFWGTKMLSSCYIKDWRL